MKKSLITSALMTIVTTILLGLIYPLVITGLAQLFFRDKANGQLIDRDGALVGSRIIGQPFSSSAYFHSRPSMAGNGYDAANSGGSNLAATNHKLVESVADRVKAEGDGSSPVPIDLVTTSASGLDPDITPAAAQYQVQRVAKARHLDSQQVEALVARHTEGRTFSLLGEPRVNVLELNLALDSMTQSGSYSAH